MCQKISEVVKEYVLLVDGFDQTVKGRVCIDIDLGEDPPYSWDISHNYRPQDAGGIYYPSKKSAATFKEAENLLLAYMKCFTAIEVKANELF